MTATNTTILLQLVLLLLLLTLCGPTTTSRVRGDTEMVPLTLGSASMTIVAVPWVGEMTAPLLAWTSDR